VARHDGFQKPRKRLGQHFLTDRRILDRIAGALQLTGTETVIEVGPGRGALTDRLVERCGRLLAIELDRDLVPFLRERYAAAGHVMILEADVLDVDLAAVAAGPYVLVGNVPYYITTPILFHALRTPRPARAVYLVQREVAERVAAKPGSKDYGALTVNVQTVADAQIVFNVPAEAFDPPPKVESAVLRITPREVPLIAPEDEEPFRRFVLAAFTQRRKQLKAIVRQIANVDTDRATALIESIGIKATERAEQLTPPQFVTLYGAVVREGHQRGHERGHETGTSNDE
jgi:16S rRNA (adenine1518-N6/adenine1519-N6)-dimethyltransferase